MFFYYFIIRDEFEFNDLEYYVLISVLNLNKGCWSRSCKKKTVPKYICAIEFTISSKSLVRWLILCYALWDCRKYGHFVEFLSEMCHIEGTHQIGEKYLLNATQRIQNLKHVIRVQKIGKATLVLGLRPVSLHKEKKPVGSHIYEGNPLPAGQVSSIVQGSQPESCSSSILSNDAREFFAHGNWDEIVSDMELSFDPSSVNNFKIMH